MQVPEGEGPAHTCGRPLQVEGTALQVEGTAGTAALRVELCWFILGAERRPEWIKHLKEGRENPRSRNQESRA